MRRHRATLVLFPLCLAYAVVRYIVIKGVPWSELPLFVTNKALAFTSLALFGLAAVARDPERRRAAGLTGLTLASVHTVITLCLLPTASFAPLFAAFPAGRTLRVGPQLALLAGAAGLVAVAFAAHRVRLAVPALLLLGVLHCAALGWPGWWRASTWPGRLPPITLLASATAALALVALGLRARVRRRAVHAPPNLRLLGGARTKVATLGLLAALLLAVACTDGAPSTSRDGGAGGDPASPDDAASQGPGPGGLPRDGVAARDGSPAPSRDGAPRDGAQLPEAGAPASGSFRFIAWGDTKSGTSTLSALSNQALALNPKFTIYAGDMISTWSDAAMDKWRTAANGDKSNGIFDITFTVRGNHDASGSATGYFNWMAKNHPLDRSAAAIGAKSFSHMPGRENGAYSFDYANAHFVGLDSTGDADTIKSDQIAWLDADLAAASKRGMTHAFLWFHGPIYCVAGHCDCTTNICKSGIYALVAVLNKYNFVSATFHGHEHVYTYTYLDSRRDPKITHPFHQFVNGATGAGPDVCDPGRYDYWMKTPGFLAVDVDGPRVSVQFHKQGGTVPEKTITWTK
ncbi:MAG: metallophosphoesterase [Deltaproteobacteria bacterium]|nr:metallophosphoesterase [Deltaproteobacteria bacterium]